MIFKKHYCVVCSKHIKWWEKIVSERKISRLTDPAGNITPYRHYEIRHYNCLTALEKKQLARQKKSKKKDSRDDNDTANKDYIYTDN